MNEPRSSLLAPASADPAAGHRRRRILRERAEALAQPELAVPVPTGIPVTCFTLGGRRFAVETALVSEVILLKELTPIPGAPAYIAGVVNRRGLILTLLDFRSLLELPSAGLTDIHAAVVLRNEEMELGLLADLLLGSALVQTVDATGPGEYLRGIAPDGLYLLDAARILADERLLLNETATRGPVGNTPAPPGGRPA